MQTEITVLASTAVPQALPAGTRVMVQRLVAEPELNDKRARVLCATRAPAGMRWRWTTGRCCR
jgi:hypothetical protein